MSCSEGVLLGYGNPLLDITIQGASEFLDKYDLKADAAILAEEKHMPMYDEMLSFKDVEFTPGGATLNAIRVVQWLLEKPHATSYLGCISKDKFGDILEKKAKDAKVNVSFQYTDEAPTGTCGVVVSGSHRSLCANLAAANCFKESHLDKEENWELVEKAKYFYIAGFPLTVCPSAILRIAKHASENNKTFCSNLAAPFICQFFKDPLSQVLPYIDYLFGNEEEALEFGKMCEFDTEDVEEIACKASLLPKENAARPRIVIFTRGANSTVVAKEGKVEKYEVIPISLEEIVDTNAAGDAFVGGFLSQLVMDKPIAECLRCGHYAANLIIRRSGCSLPPKHNFK
ncbi:adenosine kinase-like isoform X2 [Octopus vulgaris]|uniref:Adenosine kinase n=1 Tax=Octopus vulgaris TaxID=6645 RepID=A0A6C0PNF8_OCTVU|nr:adenosine kinase 2-like [Octopus vulgaris]CAI9743284.1 adenosine kinase-like isoform X2 [Octopus vulgaris]